MKLLFVPNWNGHLYIAEKEDTSVKSAYNQIEFENKEILDIPKNNIEEANNKIYESMKKQNDFVLSVTGDHSNSYPLIKAFAEKNKNFKLVIFDAHPDVEVSTEAISHEDYLRNLVEDGIIEAKNIYLFGIRTFSRVEFEYLIEKGINFYTISDILREKENIIKILKLIKHDIYLSIDIDVLDPDDAPGTYYTEWCGLRIEELEEFIDCIKRRIVSADITEFYKEKDDDNKTTEKNTIKLIESFIN